MNMYLDALYLGRYQI